VWINMKEFLIAAYEFVARIGFEFNNSMSKA
jgi:hypothetical protein